MKPVTSWFEWLIGRERRRAERRKTVRLIAHYWDGAAPRGHDIRDISSTGLYLLTEQRWYPGTLVTMSLQRAGLPDSDPDRSIRVNAKVVRSDSDGVGLAFVTTEKHLHDTAPGAFLDGSDRKALRRFLDRLRSSAGQSLIEYALLLPLLLLLIVNVVNFAGFFYAWITVANAARAGADYAVLGGVSVGGFGRALPTVGDITSVITQDISSLPNRASLQVNVCQNRQGILDPLLCTGAAADPESPYALITIDVTYTYVPFIPAGFSFPSLNVYATIPPTTIHRRAVMRMLQ